MQHRWNFRKDMLKQMCPGVDLSKTERQILAERGIYPLWDCGKKRYVIERSL